MTRCFWNGAGVWWCDLADSWTFLLVFFVLHVLKLFIRHFRIFSYLDVLALCRCAQVSKYWNLLALDGSNWQRVDLFIFQTDVEVHRFWFNAMSFYGYVSLFNLISILGIICKFIIDIRCVYHFIYCNF